MQPDLAENASSARDMSKSRPDVEVQLCRAWQKPSNSPGTKASRHFGGVNDLALSLFDRGDYPAAEGLFRRAFEGRAGVLGADHADTLTSMNDLATLLGRKGDFVTAEPLCRRTLETRASAGRGASRHACQH